MLGLRLHPFACAAGIITALLAGACSGGDLAKDDPLSLIPSDATEVVAIDTRTVLIEAGCQSRNGVIELSPDLKAAIGNPTHLALLETLASNSHKCRLDLLTAFTDSVTGARSIIVPRTPDTEFNADKLEVKDESESKHLGTVAIYRLDDGYMIVGEATIWAFDSAVDNPVAAMDEIIARALKNPMRKVDKVATLIDDTSAQVRYYRSVSTLEFNPFGDTFSHVLASARLKSTTITTDATFYNDEWEQVNPASALQPVDPGTFNRFIPANTAFIAATSADTNEYQALKEFIAAQFKSPLHRVAASLILERLGDISGTTAIALAPGGNRETISKFNPSTWQMCIVIPLAENRQAQQLLNTLEALLRKYIVADNLTGISTTNDGIRVRLKRDGSTENLYMAVIDRNIILSNYDIDSRDIDDGSALYGNESFDEAASSSCAFAAAAVPFRSELMYAWNLPCGGATDISADNEGNIHGRFTTYGSSTGILPAVLQILSKRH